MPAEDEEKIEESPEELEAEPEEAPAEEEPTEEKEADLGGFDDDIGGGPAGSILEDRNLLIAIGGFALLTILFIYLFYIGLIP